MDAVAHDAGVSRPKAFEDFLTTIVCTYRTGLRDLVSRTSGGEGVRDEEYLKTIEPYAKGKPGKRPVDLLKAMFHELQDAVAATDEDVLGDLFEGAITYGENGQFFTPDPVCELMARLAGPGGRTVHDPACGSGRLLLAVARVNRRREFVGTDIDHRCTKITAINLAMRNLYGFAIHGNALSSSSADTDRHVYRTGFNGGSWIRDTTSTAMQERLAVLEMEPERVIEEPEDVEHSSGDEKRDAEDELPSELEDGRVRGQLRLF